MGDPISPCTNNGTLCGDKITDAVCQLLGEGGAGPLQAVGRIKPGGGMHAAATPAASPPSRPPLASVLTAASVCARCTAGGMCWGRPASAYWSFSRAATQPVLYLSRL